MDTGQRILSLNVGRGSRSRERGRSHNRMTGIDKRPVDSLEVRDPGPKHGGLGSGVVGDLVANGRHHGGTTQAVYAYAREDQLWWAGQIGREVAPGGFGENITTEGVDTTHALVGETWTIGGVVLRVEVPRIPCATFAGHMDVPQWVRRFTEAGRSGAYLSVASPGALVTGAVIQVERPGHDIDLLTVFRAVTGDLVLARRVLDAGVLSSPEAAYLRAVVDRRGR